MALNIASVIDELKGVIGLIRLTCQSIIQVNNFNHFHASIPPADGPGGEGIPPPGDFIDLPYDEATRGTRKCFIAQTLIDEMTGFLQDANDMLLDEMVNVSFSALFALYVSLVALVASTAPLFSAIAGSISGILHNLASVAFDDMGTIEFSDLRTAMIARRTDLVCAMLAATTSDQARSDMVAILSNEGVSIANQTYFISFFVDDYLHHLFYQNDANIEAGFLAAVDIDCDDCGVLCELWVNPLSTVELDNGVTLRWTGEQIFQAQGDNAYYAQVVWLSQPGPVVCNETVTCTNVTVTSGAVNPQGPASWRFVSQIASFGDRYHSNNIPVAPISGVRYTLVKSDVPFTVQMDRTVDP